MGHSIVIFIPISFILLLSLIYLYRKYNKLKKARCIQFSNILDHSGQYGMARVPDPTESYPSTLEFYIEFKIISKARSVNGTEYLNIRVVNVVPLVPTKKDYSDAVELLLSLQWIDGDSREIYWYEGNESRKRDVILTEILGGT